MDWRSAGTLKEERHAPARARGAEDSGGAAGPSTVKGEIEMFYQKFKKLTVFLCCGTLGRRCADPFFCVVLCWQNVKICECLLGMPSFQCIRGGSVPSPMPCQTLGRAAHRKAHRLALAEAPILFFSIILCWQNVKICECLLGMPSFQCIRGGSVPPPMPCRTLGRATRRMARHLALPQAPM